MSITAAVFQDQSDRQDSNPWAAFRLNLIIGDKCSAASAEEGDWKVHFSPKLYRGRLQWCNRSIVSICVRIWPPLHHITLLYLITSTDNKTECDWLLDTCIAIISIRNHFSNHQVETPSYCSLLQHHKQTWSLLQYYTCICSLQPDVGRFMFVFHFNSLRSFP